MIKRSTIARQYKDMGDSQKEGSSNPMFGGVLMMSVVDPREESIDQRIFGKLVRGNRASVTSYKE